MISLLPSIVSLHNLSYISLNDWSKLRLNELHIQYNMSVNSVRYVPEGSEVMILYLYQMVKNKC